MELHILCYQIYGTLDLKDLRNNEILKKIQTLEFLVGLSIYLDYGLDGFSTKYNYGFSFWLNSTGFRMLGQHLKFYIYLRRK